jgi:hypothetical protein
MFEAIFNVPKDDQKRRQGLEIVTKKLTILIRVLFVWKLISMDLLGEVCGYTEYFVSHSGATTLLSLK